VLGGTLSWLTDASHDAFARPTVRAARSARRTQQIIAHETGVVNTADPLGGSYFVEALTDRMEAAAYEYFAKIDELGGMVAAIEQNYPQREIADASFQYQCEVDDGKRIVVGVNRYANEGDAELPILRIDPALERKQVDRLQGARARRDSEAVERTLVALKEAASRDENLMEPLLDCARAHASEGEIVESLQGVFGTYTETPVF
jgi:methylmalonyl-CoA mutase N-terminal domain/subunit